MKALEKEELLRAKIPCEETGITVKTGICGFCGDHVWWMPTVKTEK